MTGHRASAGFVSGRVTLAVALRVLTQLRRDHRTLAIMLVLPCLLMSLLWWMFSQSSYPATFATGQLDIFDRIAPALLAIFPFIVMFLVTSVTTLRERGSGTLERLLSMPMGKGDFLLGYALAFGVVAAVQAALAVGLAVGVLGLDITGPVWLLGVVAVVDALLGTALGLFVSAFAQTEFQAVQFMPALVVPQILLCGLFRDRSQLPDVLSAISDVLPLSFAVDAMSTVRDSADTGAVWGDLSVIVGFVLAGLLLGAATLRRRTP
jgi:ABC-2 type transport system permease protein